MKVTFRGRIQSVDMRSVSIVEGAQSVHLSIALMGAIPTDVLVTIEFEPTFAALESHASDADNPQRGVY